MKNIRILWTDDEIEILKPHILFLEEKGYELNTCTNGVDTIDMVEAGSYDIIFLDENMPGMSGIDTLKAIKEINPDIPVVMITKSEEENIMDAAIGSKIADYLIKPVNPNQILLSIKRITERGRLINEKTTNDYQAEFNNIRMMTDAASSFDDWIDLYRKLVYWDLELDNSTDSAIREILEIQEKEANASFGKFISNEYLSLFEKGNNSRPVLSPDLLKDSLFPLIKNGENVFFILIDNLRYDQWKVMQSEISSILRILDDKLYYSILPTATQYARNSIFAGMMPMEIEKEMPRLWIRDDEEEGKNRFEEDLLKENLRRNRIDCRWSYHKISNNTQGKKVIDTLHDLLANDLTVLVYNFVDMISHARTDSGLIRDIADDEPAYRSLTRSWFIHSPLMDLLRKLQGEKIKIVITTDHGTIRVTNPVKVIGDRKTSSNLRYKLGKNLDYSPKQVFEIKQPKSAHLPLSNITSTYIFARSYDFLVYPNNYNHVANYFRNTFQHGGISMQEMIVPVATLEPL